MVQMIINPQERSTLAEPLADVQFGPGLKGSLFSGQLSCIFITRLDCFMRIVLHFVKSFQTQLLKWSLISLDLHLSSQLKHFYKINSLDKIFKWAAAIKEIYLVPYFGTYFL